MHPMQRESGYCTWFGLVVPEDLLNHVNFREDWDYLATLSF